MTRSSFFTSSKGSNVVLKMGLFIIALATTPQPPFLLENLIIFSGLKKGSEEDREGPSFSLSESETHTDEELPTTLKSGKDRKKHKNQLGR